MSQGFLANRNTRVAIAHVCALVVAAYFIYAAVGKIGWGNTRQFAIEIKNYKIFTEHAVNLPAIFMPWLEIFAAIALLIPRTRPAGVVLIGGMLLAFIGMIIFSVFGLGLSISCGCTGAGSGEAGLKTIILDVALLIATLASAYLYYCRCEVTENEKPAGLPVQTTP